MSEQLFQDIEKDVKLEPNTFNYIIGYNVQQQKELCSDLTLVLSSLPVVMIQNAGDGFEELCFNNKETALKTLNHLHRNKVICYSKFL